MHGLKISFLTFTPEKIDVKIFDTLTNLHTAFNNKHKGSYKLYLAQLEIDLAEYYAIMNEPYITEVELLQYYSRLWEF